MKVLYDYQAFYGQKFGGVSNCFVQLIKRLPSNVEYEIALKESDNIHLRESGLVDVQPCSLTYENFITKNNFKGRKLLYDKFSNLFPQYTSLGKNRLYSIAALKKGDFDVFHPTFFDDYFLPYIGNKPFVITVHDMMPELFPQYFKQPNPETQRKQMLCEKAAAIIAVSENTKNDLIEIMKIPERKINIIYHGGPKTEKVKTPPLIGGEYFLYVGQRTAYKNFKRTLLDFSVFINRYTNIFLVCTGKPFNSEEERMINSLRLNNNIIYCNASDKEMKNLYAHALGFIYPSLYEGFGMPILEAYAYGCPVLLNNESCFPEIAGDAAVFFNSNENSSNLATIMNKYMNMKEEERKLLLQKQYRRLKKFSWDKSAKQLSDIYASVL